MLDGRKIARTLENPIDNVLIDLAERMNPTLRSWGITPNMLTTGALVTGLWATYVAWHGHFAAAAALSILSYYFDTLDGNMARMFHMVTSFGDWYDHVSDVVKYTLLYIVIACSMHLPRWFKITFFLITFGIYIFTLMHIGCQEKSYTKPTKDSLSLLEPLCPNPNMIHMTKYMGIGTWIYSLVVLLFIASVVSTKK